ncbi:MAG: hypothetical protein JNK00_12500 [Flavipsychrobacter sp.]|nr:hypothetical protein [Flavipsychrobacter sp.]
MRHTYAKRFSVAILLLSAISVKAQNSNKENSPYSRFGIGEMRNGMNVMMKGMGSISSSFAHQINVNTENPASYASLKLTTYEAAGEANTRTVQAANEKYQTGMATLSYMNIGIPVGKYMGMAIGLRPMSRVYYRLNDTVSVDSFGTAVKGYQGDGSLNEGFIGFAGKYKGFSVGFNFGYIFGSIENISSLEPLDNSARLVSSGFYTRTKLGGIYWKAGAMYEHSFNDKLGIRGGGTVSVSQKLNGSKDQYWISYNNYAADTAFRSEAKEGTIVLPMTYTAGAQLYGMNWLAGVDFKSSNWSQFRNYGTTDSLAASAYRIAVGGEYTPDPNATRKYFQRVTYRLGGYYGTDAVMLRGLQLDYYAVTAGFTFPFKKNVSRIHTSFEFGSRGTKANGLLRENFVRFGLGISLNDKWFIKRKYD